MRKLVLFLVSLLFAAENAAAQMPDIGQKKDKPQLSLTAATGRKPNLRTKRTKVSSHL